MTSTPANGLIFVFLLTLLMQPTAFAQSPQDNYMQQFRWKHRVVLVFTDAATAQSAATLIASIEADSAGFSERHMVLINITGSKAHADQKRLSNRTAEQLQTKYNADQAAFRTVLVGKDGGVKLDSKQATTLEDIYALIDTMPMRRQEMRQQAKKRGK